MNTSKPMDLPIKAVVRKRRSRAHPRFKVQCILVLECGHEVGLQIGFTVPDKAPCLMCGRAAGVKS